MRAEIRQILTAEKQEAAIKAYGEVETSLQPIRAAVTKYRQALTQYNIDLSDGKEATKPQPPNYDALAKQAGLTYHATGLIPAAEMADLDIGRSMVEGSQSLLSYAYTTSNMYRPRMAGDMGQNVYLFWKTDSSEERVPKFDDEGIRNKVLAAWKLGKAREIALEEAEKLADETRKSKKSLKQSIGNLRLVESTGPFTWVTQAPVPGAQGQTRLVMNRVDHVDKPGDKFMLTVYGLEVGQTAVTMNQPEDVAYVVQLQNTEPSNTVLWIGFEADPYSMYAAIGQSDQMNILNTWLEDIREDAGLVWERKPVPPARRERR